MIVVVGAGPAGMAAAETLAAEGAAFTLIDDGPARPMPGGAYRPGRAVWMVTPTLEIWHVGPGGSECLAATALIAATGGMARPGADPDADPSADHAVPEPQMARALGCDHAWRPTRRWFVPVTDAWGRSSVACVWIAGMAADRADAAASGRLAALDAMHCAGRLSVTRRDALAGSSRPDGTTSPRLAAPPLDLDDSCVVCPCEGVTAGAVRAVVAQGCPGPNQAKSFLRIGMGACQGRLCGTVLSELIATGRGVSPDEIGYLRIRPPLRPITVGDLASSPSGNGA